MTSASPQIKDSVDPATDTDVVTNERILDHTWNEGMFTTDY
jgi:hypothetical protein